MSYSWKSPSRWRWSSFECVTACAFHFQTVFKVFFVLCSQAKQQSSRRRRPENTLDQQQYPTTNNPRRQQQLNQFYPQPPPSHRPQHQLQQPQQQAFYNFNPPSPPVRQFVGVNHPFVGVNPYQQHFVFVNHVLIMSSSGIASCKTIDVESKELSKCRTRFWTASHQSSVIGFAFRPDTLAYCLAYRLHKLMQKAARAK